ncbi:hypothetical protein ACVBIO_17050 [Shewanella sp. 0m-8]
MNSEVSLLSLSLGLKKINKKQLVFSIVILLLVVISIFIATLLGDSYKLSSLAISVITLLLISMTKVDELYSLKPFLIRFAVVSVYVSVAFSLIDTYLFPLLDARTNFVLVMNRLTFLFDEPSQYAIFLALILHVVDFKRESSLNLLILGCGLFLTWSLSGFLLVAILFLYRRVIMFDRKMIQGVVFIFCFSIALVFFWNNYLINTDFWLVSKVQSVQMLLDGDRNISSALVRATSMFMYVYYIADTYSNSSFLSFVYGEGYGNLNEWVSAYYFKELNITTMTEVNNFISSIIIQNGFHGILLFFVAFYSCFQSGIAVRPKATHFLVTVFIVALFTGNAYGSLAILYYYLSILVSVELPLQKMQHNKKLCGV